MGEYNKIAQVRYIFETKCVKIKVLIASNIQITSTTNNYTSTKSSPIMGSSSLVAPYASSSSLYLNPQGKSMLVLGATR